MKQLQQSCLLCSHWSGIWCVQLHLSLIHSTCLSPCAAADAATMHARMTLQRLPSVPLLMCGTGRNQGLHSRSSWASAAPAAGCGKISHPDCCVC